MLILSLWLGSISGIYLIKKEKKEKIYIELHTKGYDEPNGDKLVSGNMKEPY